MKTAQIGAATLIHGDCIASMPNVGTVDAIVCDPPYDLLTVSRNGSARRNDPTTPFGRTDRGGFKNMQWDATGIAFDPTTWRAAFNTLRPGGFLLAFGGTRTYHRMVCAIEDAGFVIQDTIMWIYGSGFPKNKALLKPAWEPICVAYKPGGKRTLQVDECRIPATSENASQSKQGEISPGFEGGFGLTRRAWTGEKGRWPANICHDGSDEVMAAFAAFGETRSGAMRREVPGYPGRSVTGMLRGRSGPSNQHGDSGSPARFFYAAKAATKERAGSKHPTVKPLALMRYLVKLVTPPDGLVFDPFAGSGTTLAVAKKLGRNYLGVELFCGARRFLLWRRRRHEADKSVAVSARANGGGSGTAAVAVRCAFAKGIAEPIGKTRIWEIEAGGDERRMAYGSAKKCLVTVEEEPIIVLSG